MGRKGEGTELQSTWGSVSVPPGRLCGRLAQRRVQKFAAGKSSLPWDARPRQGNFSPSSAHRQRRQLYVTEVIPVRVGDRTQFSRKLWGCGSFEVGAGTSHPNRLQAARELPGIANLSAFWGTYLVKLDPRGYYSSIAAGTACRLSPRLLRDCRCSDRVLTARPVSSPIPGLDETEINQPCRGLPHYGGSRLTIIPRLRDS